MALNNRCLNMMTMLVNVNKCGHIFRIRNGLEKKVTYLSIFSALESMYV